MVNMSRLQTPEASDPFYRVKKELKNLHPTARLRYSSQFAKETHQRSSVSRAQSCPAGGIDVDEINEFKLELVRRHNPHARRVCHIKGLNDVPVCVVRDELNTDWENRFIVSPGSFGPALGMGMKSNKPKTLEFRPGQIGSFTDRSVSRSSSRISVPKMTLIPPQNFENDLSDELDSIKALDILCSILETNSLQTVQAWIEQATDDERIVVLKALRDMKDKGVLLKPSYGIYNSNLPSVPEISSYQKKWAQSKSVEEVIPFVPPADLPPTPLPTAKTPVSTQTPVSVIRRPPTRIQMTGLSSPAPSLSASITSSRPSTMKSVREKFQSSIRTSPAKDPGFSWRRKEET